ncbi:MAG: MlrC C-terminal domain-containing protein, partial [Spirochaetales bacterium]|nr:MlrC C-terminal domain-containing protein [Spirochaetales bacterium]
LNCIIGNPVFQGNSSGSDESLIRINTLERSQPEIPGHIELIAVSFTAENINIQVDIVICETISFPGDLQLYRHFGVEPTFYQLVNVKACTSFRVAYEPIASEICETETPGTAPINLRSLKFKKLPSRFFPFNNLDSYIIPDPITKEELLKDR